MTNTATPLIILPGAGGMDEIQAFKNDLEATTPFKTVCYPTWQPHFAGGFHGERLVALLAARISHWVPSGPIRIVGYSIGGHLAYLTALTLEAGGREIAGLCAIDPFLNSRALTKGWHLLRALKFGELARLSRTKLRRMVLRASGGRLANLPGSARPTDSSNEGLDPDPRAEAEVLLWLRDATAWISSLDRHPVALNAPAILLRTRLFAVEDATWRRRCPNVCIHEVAGQHLTLFEPQNIGSLRNAFLDATREWN